MEDDELALAMLQQALAGDGDELTPALLARVAQQAAELDPQLARAAAQRALDSGELAAGRRSELVALVARFTPEGDPAPAAGPAPARDRERKPLPQNVFYEESDRSSFGESGDLSALDDFPEGVVTDAVPCRLAGSGLVVQAGEAGELELAFSRLRAVAVAGVHGLGPRPVVLIDLLLDGGGSERPLSLVRLRSDRFDPRPLAPGAGSPLDALRLLVKALLEGAGALPLPDPAGAAGRPVRLFETLDAYHEQVLRPAGRRLG
jgi:hypothetical protein